MYDNCDLTNKEIEKLSCELSGIKVTCDCGHRVHVLPQDRVICTWCGHYVYKDEKTRFKYEMLKKMREVNYEYHRKR